MGKKFEIVGSDLSDGYHTFDELYEHRISLFLALCWQMGSKVFYKLPEPDFAGWFIVYLELPTGQISYHLPEIYLHTVGSFATHDESHKWDGHDSATVLSRLKRLMGDTP